MLFALTALGFSSCAHLTPRTTKPWQVIAHRAASGYLPEHTLVGVAMAAAWGVDFVEPDVVLTRDDVPVVLHDIHLEASTDVAKKFPFRKRKDGRYYVRDFRLIEIKTLNVLERAHANRLDDAVFPKRFPRHLNRASFTVPTFEEYLEFVEGLRHSTGRRLGIYPEIKHSEFHAREGQDIVKIVHAMLVRFGYEKTPDLIYLQSFNPADLKRLKHEFGTQIPLVQLIGKNSWNESSADYDQMQSEEGLREIATYASAIGPSLDQLFSIDTSNSLRNSTPLAEHARALGLKLHPYTHRQDPLPVPFRSNTELFEALRDEAQIDGIFSDFADEVLIWLGRLPTKSKAGH